MPHNLTHEEEELIQCLMEECSEVIHTCTKILRHGAESFHPDTGKVNIRALHQELGDVQAILHMLKEIKFLDQSEINQGMYRKQESVAKYLHYSSLV